MVSLRQRHPRSLFGAGRPEPAHQVSESDLFVILWMCSRARDLSDAELAAEWNRTNAAPEVTAWYYVVLGEANRRWPPGTPGRRGGSMVRVDGEVRVAASGTKFELELT